MANQRTFTIARPGGVRAGSERKSWTGTAFLIESLVLLVFLAGTIAVLAQLFAYSVSTANSAQQLSQAATVAQNAAEEFSSNPVAVAEGQQVGQGVALNGTSDFAVTCTVTANEEDNGTLYVAHIAVSPRAATGAGAAAANNAGAAEAAYELDTARYVGIISNDEGFTSTDDEDAGAYATGADEGVEAAAASAEDASESEVE